MQKDRLMDDEKLYKQHFMVKALSQAKKAAGEGEIPIGVVIVKDGQIIAGHTTKETKKEMRFIMQNCLPYQKPAKIEIEAKRGMFVTVVPVQCVQERL